METDIHISRVDSRGKPNKDEGNVTGDEFSRWQIEITSRRKTHIHISG
jgi:hypothetical protein